MLLAPCRQAITQSRRESPAAEDYQALVVEVEALRTRSAPACPRTRPPLRRRGGAAERTRPAAITTASRRTACRPTWRGRTGRPHAAGARPTSSPRWNSGPNGLICSISRSTSSWGAAHRQGWDVVNGLVRVQLGHWRRVLQRIDDMGLDAEQTQLEDLEQAGRTRPDDDGVGLEGAPAPVVSMSATAISAAPFG